MRISPVVAYVVIPPIWMTALPSPAPSTSYVAPGVQATNGMGANARTDASAMKTTEDTTAVQVWRVTGPPRCKRPRGDDHPRRFGHSAACHAIYLSAVSYTHLR